MLDRKNQPTVLTIDQGWARGVSERSDYTYTLMDLMTPRLYLIDMGEKNITDVSDVFFKGRREDYILKSIGAGPEIAGRGSIEFQVFDPDDGFCSRIFVWPSPAEPELRQVQRMIARIQIHPEALLPLLGPAAKGLLPNCVRAEMDALHEISQHGLIAMRINNKGETTLRISKLRNSGTTEACMMRLPTQYETETPLGSARKTLARRLFGGRDKPAEPLYLKCP